MSQHPLADELNRLFGNGWKSVPVSAGGFSGARVAKIESSVGTFALKSHPKQFRDRVLANHAFQEFLATQTALPIPCLHRWSQGRIRRASVEEHGIGRVVGTKPPPDTLLVKDESCWELSDWMPGQPVRSTGWIRDESLNHVIDAIAAMHSRVRDWSPNWSIPADCTERGLELRANKLLGFVQSGFDKCKAQWELFADRHGHPVLLALGRILSQARALGARLLEPMQSLATNPHPSHWIARDLWREHFLFDGDGLTGIIDFTASKISWPGLDLSRSLGTFLLDEDPRWESAVERYRSVAGPNEIEFNDIRVTHRVSTLLSAMHYVELACQSLDNQQATKAIYEPRIAARILELEISIDSIAMSLQRTDA